MESEQRVRTVSNGGCMVLGEYLIIIIDPTIISKIPRMKLKTMKSFSSISPFSGSPISQKCSSKATNANSGKCS